MHEAKTHLSRLVDEVGEGEEIVIAKAGRPVARLVPMHSERKRRKLGWLAGRFTVPDDFDAALPGDVIAQFESAHEADR